MDLLKNDFTHIQRINLYKKCIKCVNDIWNSGEQDFLTKEQTRKKFKLTHPEEREWEELTNMISGK